MSKLLEKVYEIYPDDRDEQQRRGFIHGYRKAFEEVREYVKNRMEGYEGINKEALEKKDYDRAFNAAADMKTYKSFLKFIDNLQK